MYWHHQRGAPWNGRDELMRAMDTDAITKKNPQPQPYAALPSNPTINLNIQIPAINIIQNQPPQLLNNNRNIPMQASLWSIQNNPSPAQINPWSVPTNPWPVPSNSWLTQNNPTQVQMNPLQIQSQEHLQNIRAQQMQLQLYNSQIQQANLQNNIQNSTPGNQTPHAQHYQVNANNQSPQGNFLNAYIRPPLLPPRTTNIQQVQPRFGFHHPLTQSQIRQPHIQQPVRQSQFRGHIQPPIQYRPKIPVTSAQVIKSGGQLSQSQQGIFQNACYWYPAGHYATIQPETYENKPPLDEQSHESIKEKTVVVPQSFKQTKKKPTPWKNKNTNFNHQFLSTSLMGHSGKIMGMDCTADTKYLVTCADDERPADFGDGSSSGSEASKENRSPSESPTGSSPGSPSGSRRSTRRRRKPRLTREQRTSDSVSPPPTYSSPISLSTFSQLKLSEQDLANAMSRYLLNNCQLSSLGYPIEDPDDPTRVFIIATDFGNQNSKHTMDANAREFIPRKRIPQSRDYDSGRGSGSSSPRSGSSSPRSTDSDPEEELSSIKRKCARCTRGFLMSEDGNYITKDKCIYHYGRITKDIQTNKPIEWGCCGNQPNHPGCSTATVHVWSGTSAGVNGPLIGYVRTRQRIPGAPRHAILALDCEMVYTTAGLQVAQVEVVGADGRRIYSSYVQPDAEVVDYNIRYSGIGPRHLKNAKPLVDVQRELLKLIDEETLLVGHGLENDLRTLRLLHSRIVDTAVSYPHPWGLPYRMSLKYLAKKHLFLEVQQRHHSPVEDAQVSLELILKLVQNDILIANQRKNVIYN